MDTFEDFIRELEQYMDPLTPAQMGIARRVYNGEPEPEEQWEVQTIDVTNYSGGPRRFQQVIYDPSCRKKNQI